MNQLATGQAEEAWAGMLAAKAHHALHVVVDALPSIGTVTHKTNTITKTVTNTIVRTVRVTKIAAQAAPGATWAAVKTIAATLDDVITLDLPRLRDRARAAENEIARLWKWTRAHPLGLAGAALTAAVAATLAKLGASWIRCSNWRKAGRSVCGMDASLLESLLADSLLVFGTLSLVEFAQEMVAVTDTAVRPITTFWRAS